MEAYYLSKTVQKSYEDARTAVIEALATQGFGVLTEIDVKATLKKKLDVEMRDYCILGACNPPFAHKALGVERQVGILLPCNVVVQAAEDGTEVSVINPASAMSVVDNDALASLATDVKKRLELVLEAL